MKKAYLLALILSVIGVSAQTYCAPNYASGCSGGDQIDDFTIASAGFSHLGTGCSTGTYGNFYATHTITLAPTINYAFSATHNFSSQIMKVWADFNNDGTFDASTELIGSGSSGSTMTTNGTISLPANVAAGTYRMRVSDRYANDPVPCDVAGYGEAHDYKLVVTAPPTCIAPTALTNSAITATSVNVSWTAPATAPASGYDIFYSSTGVVPNASTVPTMSSSLTTVTINGLTPATNYCIWVRSKCTTTDASVWINSCFLTSCVAANVPYFLDFESVTAPALPLCTAVTNPGAGNSWMISFDPGNGFTNNTLAYNYNYQNAANSWFFTQGINLVAGTTYRIKYNYGNNSSSYSEKMKVTYGDAPTPAAQTNVLHDYTNIIDVISPVSDFYTLTPTTSGVYYFAFNVYSDANMYNLYVDDILVEVNPSCIEPNALAVSAVTAFTATATWAAPATAPAGGYEYYLSTSNTAPVSTTVATGTSASATLNLTSLLSSSTYYLWVRAVCTATDKSAWSSVVTFATESFCPVVTGPADAITNLSLTPTITWDPMAGADGYKITVGTTSGGTDILNDVDLGNVTSYTFTTPLANSIEYFYTINAYASGVSSNSCSIRSFTTACAAISPSYTNDFSNIDAACWGQASGGSASGGSTGTNSEWVEDGFLNNGSTGAAKINLYSNSKSGWLISPTFNLTGASYDVKFDYGMTEWNNTTSATLGSDDKVQVLMSNDNGVTWTTIQTWSAGTQISNTSTQFSYTVTGGTNQMKFAIYATEGANDDPEDNDFFVDNFTVTQSLLSTAENTLTKNNIKVYPNPFSDVLNISDVKDVKSIAVVDIAGRIVKTFEKASSDLQLRDLNAGIYVVILNMNDGTKQSIKVIKK
ncbi:fibronectin type III domain-containing protein [Chryseobacterium wangxinyae]|uniref:GEVED domain-containing protein n=1 Tax=Chryseobacterium sp. CY350 TaxID=2997336 RepID=UPI00226E53BF|nr:GEVED domain-containing protein [Chryseobacterium sp. CY350]MCY0977579.1 fibronectin type III domain-containing protein [Chryseobacterium sp. CY350]WBZ95411.1 fibronectin type III domain-containing protein [Chryseobacterium sp. CY350]